MDVGCEVGKYPRMSLSLGFGTVANILFWEVWWNILHSLTEVQEARAEIRPALFIGVVRPWWERGAPRAMLCYHLRGYPHLIFPATLWGKRYHSRATDGKTKAPLCEESCQLCLQSWRWKSTKICPMAKLQFLPTSPFLGLLWRCLPPRFILESHLRSPSFCEDSVSPQK